MSADTPDPIQRATDELRHQQKLLKSLRGKMKDLTAKTMSKDGMVTVVTGAGGEVTSITFNTQKFRRMAPAELGAVLVETIGRARAQRRDQAIAAYRPLMPPGMGLERILAGQTGLDEMVDDAIRKSTKMMADRDPGHAGARSAGKGR